MTDTALPAPKRLADSTALLVGGTAGVGLETARQLLAAGVTVAISGRNAERGAAAVRSLSGLGPVTFVRGDASTAAGAQDIESEARAELGVIDIMMCSTVPPIVPDLLFRTDIASIPDTIAALTSPPMLMTAAVLGGMRDQRSGVIINVASDAGKSATPGESVIGAAMAAIIMFSRTVAMEAKRDGIRVNVLTPSLIAGTETSERVMKEGFSAKLFAKAASMASLGVADPADLAALAVFLASPEAGRLTGQAISVNGGISAA